MKKIILTLISCITIVSCSNNDENNQTNLMKEKLVGTWKLIGYYDDMDNDPITGTNYHLVENGDVYKFSSDGQFDNVGDEINPDGIFSVSEDSVITRNFNANSLNPNMTFNDKILILNEQYLEYYPFLGEGSLGWRERYQKVEQ
ncbi:lipocalin family protein [Flavobacterium sp.]|uniref:lipocalin family protein n=1 Tax=Flavobacterium sp. TaxID=239 RepID=UPI0037537CD2